MSAEMRDALQQMTDSAERAQRNTSTLKGEVNELMKHVRESKRTLDSVVVPKLHLLLGSPSTSQGSFVPAMGGMSAMLAPAVHHQQQQQPASRPSVQRATSMSAPASPVRKPPTRANSSPMHASNVQTSATFAAPQPQSQSQALPQQPQPEPQQPQPEPQQSQVQPQQPQLQSQPQPQPPQQPPQQPQSQPQPAAASASMFTHAVPSAPAGDTMFGAAQPAPATAPVDGAHAPRPPPTVAPAVQPQARTFSAVKPINTSALAAPVTRVRASSGHPGEDFLARVKESVKHERMCVRRQENESNQRVLPPRVISPRTELVAFTSYLLTPPLFFFFFHTNRFAKVKKLVGAFQSGQITATRFCRDFRTGVGRANAPSLFAMLVKLILDPERKAALEAGIQGQKIASSTSPLSQARRSATSLAAAAQQNKQGTPAKNAVATTSAPATRTPINAPVGASNPFGQAVRTPVPSVAHTSPQRRPAASMEQLMSTAPTAERSVTATAPSASAGPPTGPPTGSPTGF